MSDGMALLGYGVIMQALALYIDLEKLLSFVENAAGITLNHKNFDLGFDDEDPEGTSVDCLLNEIDIALNKYKYSDGFAGILEKSGMPTEIELFFNNRGQAFLYLPSCLPWERPYSTLQTIEQTQEAIYRTLRPFLKDDTTFKDIAAVCDYIYDITW